MHERGPGQADGREPSAEAQGAIARHLADEHGQADFDLRRDVAFVGNPAPGAPIAFEATGPLRGARFDCRDCPGRVFPVAEPPYGDPWRNTLLRITNPALETTLLHGVGDPAERDLLIEEWDRGRLGQIQVTQARRRRSMRTKKAERPTVEARRDRCQAFLLERVEQGQSVDAAIGALLALRSAEPAAYQRIMGCAAAYAPETLRGYWKDIELAERDAARARGRQLQSARRGRAL